MVKKERKIRLKMLTTDQVRRIKLKQLKKKYRYSTCGSGRRFLLGFALRQLRSHGKRGTCKKASTKRKAVWTVISTSQATDSFPKDDYVEGEDISEVQCEESLEQDEDSLDNDKVKDAPSDQFLLPASFMANGARTFPSGSQNLPQDDRRTAALPPVQCPLEPITQFFNSLCSEGIKILEDIEAHVLSTSNSNCHHPPLKDLVFDGTTPLILACHYGNFNWVKRIVERWGVDANGVGAYFFNPLRRYEFKFSRVTPLFVAAFNGHIHILEYLVRKGADVSSKTSCEDFDGYYDGLSPLYGALNQHSRNQHCAIDVNNMVRFLLESGADPDDAPSQRPPIWTSSMCGVDATTEMIRHGLNLEQLNWKGETVLHYWVNIQSYWYDPNRKNDSIAVVKLLVDKGANFMAKDKNGFTVILAAVKSENWNCVDYFLEEDGVGQMEKIEAAEMAAAIILSKFCKHSEFERAFEYWRRALKLRHMEPDLMQKTPLTLKSGQAGEWITSAELENVINHPEEYNYQSYLVRLRIYSKTSWRAVLDLYQDSFSHCITDLKNQGRLVDLFDLLWVTLETIRHFDYEPEGVGSSIFDLRSMIDNVVKNLIRMLSKLKMDDPLLNAETFKLPLEVMIAANDFVVSDDDYNSCYCNSYYDPHMYLFLQFFDFLAGLPYKILTPDIRQSLRQLVLQNNLGENRRTLLHMACEDCEAEDLPTIWLLLLSRANPNAADNDGNVPLHTLARQHGNGAVIQSAAHLLLNYGTQLDRANDNGETAADVWIRHHQPEAGWNVPPGWCLKPVTVPNLTSLCARVVRAQNLPTNELPATLIALVEMRGLSTVP